ncbi:hypothetical protein PVNG_06133 [Plasmodium vivax North Korean]|uniref:Uncharacterized protein n=1 Tax=Plasmodium vivax North Korean TaxID=1035514 RepID=A0A0J9U1D0_PLAVI|nr:hypothetical protein PVNG_06133 [Plasmodium vivax North Korean]
MVQLSSKILGEKINLVALFKNFTFAFLTWRSLAYYDVGTFSKSIENINEHHKIWNTNCSRLLARHEQQRELKDTPFRHNLPDRNLPKNIRNVSDHIPTYSEVRRKASNNFDVYMKNYKDRYMKKKGLSKLDCYYENKLFSKFCHIRDISERMQNDKKRWKKLFLKKYGICLIIFSLIPALGLIFHILFGIDGMPGIYGLCRGGHFKTVDGVTTHKEKLKDGSVCPRKRFYDSKDTLTKFEYVNFIFTLIAITIVVFVVFYILIKVIKYENIKSGKGKKYAK